jgi:hypothetical protein
MQKSDSKTNKPEIRDAASLKSTHTQKILSLCLLLYGKESKIVYQCIAANDELPLIARLLQRFQTNCRLEKKSSQDACLVQRIAKHHNLSEFSLNRIEREIYILLAQNN